MTKKKAPVGGVSKADNYVLLDLRHVRNNDPQSRGNGVIANLNAAGYGLFEPLPGYEDKPPLWSLLTSEKPEDWAMGVGLIDEFEPDLKELAGSIAVATQLQNIGIMPIEGTDGYSVIYGMRRCLSIAYNYARSVGEMPLLVKAEIAQHLTDPLEAHFRSMQENKGRKNENKIDEGKKYMMLRKANVSIPQIAERAGVSQQEVRNCIALIKLSPEDQQKIIDGRLGVTKALTKLREAGEGPAPAMTPAEEKKTTRARMPTLVQARKIYVATEKPEDMSDEDWALWTTNDVRKFLARHMEVEYTTFRDMVRQKKEAEKAALSEEALRKAAADSENDSE